MDRIHLPIVLPEASFDDAVAAMRQANVHAFVRPDGAAMSVVTLAAALTAYADGDDDVSRAGPGRATLWTGPDAAYEALGVELQSAFGREPNDFIALKVDAGLAEIVTRFETLATPLRGRVRLCRCRTTARHVFQHSEVAQHPRCNFGDGDLVCD